MRIPRPLPIAALAAVLAIGPTAAPVAGQLSCSSMSQCGALTAPVDLQRELSTVGLNALLGGMTAAVSRAIHGEPIWDGFLVGALGGGVTYAGKRVAVEDFGGAGLLGREVASVGGSMVRNAMAGRGAFDELVLPVGPVRLYISQEGGVLPRVDLATLITAGAFIVGQDARLDMRASLSAGALVLRGHGAMPGLTSAGTMMLWSDMPASEGPRLMAHERVHVLQYDQAFLWWGEPADRWLADRSPGPRGLFRYLDTGTLPIGLRTGLSLGLPYAARPWEREAYLMAEITHPIPQSPAPAGP